jgi:hypothetical protein
MKQIILSLVLLSSQHLLAKSFDFKLLSNNKEPISRQITRSQARQLNTWLAAQPMARSELKAKSMAVLNMAMTEFMTRKMQCDLGLPSIFINEAVNGGIIHSADELPSFLTYLREENIIDDIFYKILKDSFEVSSEMAASQDNKYPRRPFRPRNNINEEVDIAKMYSSFKSWPNDIESCSMGRYLQLINSLKVTGPKDRDARIRRYNYLALQSGVISLETYHKLDVMRRMEVLSWSTNVNGYLDLVQNAKDKLAKEVETSTNNQFNESYISRKEKLTRRGRLYQVFSSTQVMILAQLIEKTAKRMDARHVNLNFQYTEDADSESEIYVLSPMEQYRVSIRMLRKDMAEIMMSNTFRGSGVRYEDLISAAFETGFIKSDELDHVLKFEEFWNPKNSRWRTYANFAFSLTGTASFFLPTPFNVIGAIALVITQSRLMDKKKNDSDDNWNAIL